MRRPAPDWATSGSPRGFPVAVSKGDRAVLAAGAIQGAVRAEDGSHFGCARGLGDAGFGCLSGTPTGCADAVPNLRLFRRNRNEGCHPG